MKTIMKIPLALTLAAVLVTTGCQQTSQQTSQRRPAAVAGEKPAPKAAAARQTCAEPTHGLVSLAKQMPKEAVLGQTFEYVLTMTAQDCVDNVVVTDQIPAGASYVKSEPAAQVDGSRLVWKLPAMDAGQSSSLKVWVKADKEGTLASCATISADPRVCASTFVGKPALSIEKTGPETAMVGGAVTYNIVVANKGSAIARNVVVTDTIPAGLTSADGKSTIVYQVGDLGPNQSKTISVPLRAAARGKHCNVATAESSNAGKVSDEACTVVLQPGLKIFKTGDKEQFLSRNARYTITVTNTGDAVLNDVVVTDLAPDPTSIVVAEGASVSGKTATWRLASLRPGEGRTFTVSLTSRQAGEWCNGASVVAAGGLRDSAQACTLWRGVSALLLEKSDNPDPIQVGETTTYTVRVTNQGTADDTDVKVVVEFPKEITPVSADNGGVVKGSTVTFPAFPRLAPKQSFEYHVTAKGASVGDARVTFIRTSKDIPAPTTAEESTRVY